MAAKCQSGINHLDMKTKAEYLSKAKKSQWFKFLMAHKPHRDENVARRRRGRDGYKHMAGAYWWIGLNSLLSVGLCQLVPAKQEIVPVYWWKEAVVFLFFPFLPLVWFRLNSHCLEVIFLLLSFSFPLCFFSSQVPLSVPGSTCIGLDLQSSGVQLWTNTKHHSFCQAPLCFPCISFCC